MLGGHQSQIKTHQTTDVVLAKKNSPFVAGVLTYKTVKHIGTLFLFFLPIKQAADEN